MNKGKGIGSGPSLGKYNNIKYQNQNNSNINNKKQQW